jgi:hypothetical protein
MPIGLPSVPPMSFDSSTPGRDLCRGNSSASRGSERKSRRYTPYARDLAIGKTLSSVSRCRPKKGTR